MKTTDENKSNQRWNEDFPFKTELEEYITRRDFLRMILIVSGGLMVGNFFVLFRSLSESKLLTQRMDLGSVDTLKVGTSKVFHYPTANDPKILIRRLNGNYVAFDLKCPHLQCPISYEVDKGESLVCHCHNGAFDLDTGRGIQGPPREFRPLREVLLDVSDRIWAVGIS